MRHHSVRPVEFRENKIDNLQMTRNRMFIARHIGRCHDQFTQQWRHLDHLALLRQRAVSARRDQQSAHAHLASHANLVLHA